MREYTYEEHRLTWRGIGISVRFCRDWSPYVAHLSVSSDGDAPLPITGTGYRSHFLPVANPLADWNDDPVAFVTAWLEAEAKSPEWSKAQQLSLF